MKERRTFLLPKDSGLSREDVQVSGDKLELRRAHESALERRITARLGELPAEVRVFLEDFHDIHIRLSSARNDDVVQASNVYSPFTARVPPGLHVLFTPKAEHRDSRLCDVIKQFISPQAKCSPSPDSFSRPARLTDDSSSLSTRQFYETVLDSAGLISRIEAQLCNAQTAASSWKPICDLLSAADTALHIDVDFDAVDGLLTMSVFWTPSADLRSQQQTHEITKPAHLDQLEVGVLQPEKPAQAGELSMGGFLTMVGEADHPSGTLFSFPSRHHAPSHDIHFSARFQQPTGLHPKYEITLPTRHLQLPDESCGLYAYWTLPSTLFIDRYQLADGLFLESQNLVALHSLSGEQDLEAPDWAIHRWGSAALVELAHPSNHSAPSTFSNWTITIPTHLRYLQSMSPSTESDAVDIPWPVVFWACNADEDMTASRNPFDRSHLGYDVLFAPNTIFHHITPTPGHTLSDHLNVPTLNSDQIAWVPLGTLVAVAAGFLWICFQLLAPRRTTEAQKKKKAQ